MGFAEQTLGPSSFLLLHIQPPRPPDLTLARLDCPESQPHYSMDPVPFSALLLFYPLHLFQNSNGNSMLLWPGFLKHIPYFLENKQKDGVGVTNGRPLMLMH